MAGFLECFRFDDERELFGEVIYWASGTIGVRPKSKTVVLAYEPSSPSVVDLMKTLRSVADF